MCGIVAIVGGAPVADAELDRALDAIAHRGPDGRGRWRAPRKQGSIDVTFGHVRLAVLEVADGAQPVESEDGGVVAIVNGEIYDHLAVARELEARGHRLRGRGDAELVVHLYEEHGDDFIARLRGELSFALWDAKKQRLLAGRDRFGVKPLVWSRRGDGVVVASEAKALFALGVTRAWDDESFFHAAHTQYPWPDRTLFSGVFALEPGSLLAFDRGRVTTRSWSRARSGSPPACAPCDVRAALDDAVRLRTVAHAKVAVQLSGGLDSSAVLAIAARHRADLGAFTVSFAGAAGYDERELAAATARAVGVPLEVVSLDARALADTWPAAVAHGEGLAVNAHIVGKFALSRAMQRAGFKVALTGEGADELFAGYAHLRRDALRARGDDAEIEGNAASRGVMLPSGDALPLDGVRARLGFVPTWIEAKATLGRRVRELLSGDLIARYAGVDPYGALVDHAAIPSGPDVRRSAHAWSRTALASYILRTLGDGMEMAHGVEGRVPFLDAEVADVALAIEPEALVTRAIDKPVLRAALEGILPADVLARAKHPFLAPPLFAIAPALAQDLLRAHARRSPLVDGAKLVALLDRLPSLSRAELRAWDPALMLLLSAAILEAA